MMISAVILTKNEELNIKTCLESLKFCSEMIVVDDNSTDKTREICRKLGAKVFIRKLDNDFSSQRNFGLEKAKEDWILFLDADEQISPRLAEEMINKLKDAKDFSGFYFKRQDKFLGRWLGYGETSRVQLLRLAKKTRGKWEGKVHEVWQGAGSTAEFNQPIIHDRRLTVSQMLEKINYYSDIRARELYENKQKTNMFWITAYPIGKFCQNYLWRFGFLDGMPGLILAMLMSLHSFMVRGKLWVIQKNHGREEFMVKDWQKYS